ncbi:MAG TPA: signal peptidase I [Clostridiales bacterium]|nr:signal peptidase I [Clostridiales bacterium]
MKIIKGIFEWIFHIVFCVAIALAIVLFVIQFTYVDGHSMEPTLDDQDRILISKVQKTLGIQPDRGDIVVLDSRIDQSRNIKDLFLDYFKYNTIAYKVTGKKPEPVYLVKRVIGKEGDVLEFKDGQLLINGQPVNEPYIKEPMEWFPNRLIVVPEGHVFVMGDNRNESYDSRSMGFIPLSHIIGQYLLAF